MKSVRIIYFSPTGTTRRVLEGIAQGLAVQTIEHIDLTSAGARRGTIREFDEGLTLIGTPVYTGRVPVQAADALHAIKTAGAPAVLVVVYGNRAYEDALLELKGIALEAGFKPLAGAAFVGEHSFSTNTIPIAAGRPDGEDLEKARSFGDWLRGMVGAGRRSGRRPPSSFPAISRIATESFWMRPRRAAKPFAPAAGSAKRSAPRGPSPRPRIEWRLTGGSAFSAVPV